MTTKEFNKLSKRQQRVAIAKDVIKALNSGQIIPRSQYTDAAAIQGVKDFFDSKVFQKFLKTEAHCEVCAKGAMFISKIRLGNNISANDYGMAFHTSDRSNLDGLYSQDVWDCFEKVFEGRILPGNNEEKIAEFFKLPYDGFWCIKTTTATKEERMRAICETIIRHKGDLTQLTKLIKS